MSADPSLNVISTGDQSVSLDLSWNPAVTIVKASLICTQSIVQGSGVIETIQKVNVTGSTSYTFNGLTNGQSYLFVYQVQVAPLGSASSTNITVSTPPLIATPSTTPSDSVISGAIVLDEGFHFDVSFGFNGGSGLNTMEVAVFGNDNTFQSFFVDISASYTQIVGFDFINGTSYGGVTAVINNGTTYVVAVYTYNDNGTSGISNTLEITPSNTPNACQNVYDVAGTTADLTGSPPFTSSPSGTISIRWDAPDDAQTTPTPVPGYTDIDTYIITISGETTRNTVTLSGTAYQSSLGNLTDMSYTILNGDITDGYVLGNNYTLSIVARSVGGSLFSPSVTASPAPVVPYTEPGVPTNVEATADAPDVTAGGVIYVSWTEPDNTGGYPILYYDVSGFFGGTTTNTYLDISGLTNGVTYGYQVRAVTTVGITSINGPYSSVVTATPYDVPSAISDLSAVPGNSSVTLSWTPPSDNGSAITIVTLEISGNGVDTSSNIIGLPDVSSGSYTVTGLVNGALYSFNIFTSNARGQSVISNNAIATPATLPTAPTDLSGTTNPPLAPDNYQVYLTWTAPSNTGGYPILSYDISARNSYYTNLLVNTGSSDTNYLLDLSVNSVPYQTSLAVRAVTALGAGPWSSGISVQVAGTPQAPFGVSAEVVGSGEVRVYWGGIDRNGGTMEAYILEISGNNGYDLSFSFVPTSYFNSNYTVTGLTNGVTYTFILYGVNNRGQGPGRATGPVIPVTAPSAPTNLQSNQLSTTSVQLTWNPPGDLIDNQSGGSTIDYFTVYSYPTSTSTDASAVAIATVSLPPSSTTTTDLSYSLTGLTEGVTYKYGVASHSAGGFSTIDSLTFIVADVPIITDVSFVSLRQLNFIVNSGAIPLINYTVYARPANPADLSGGLTPYVEGDNTNTGEAVVVSVTFGYDLAETSPGSGVAAAYIFSIANARGLGYSTQYTPQS